MHFSWAYFLTMCFLYQDWGTVNPECYTISANDGQKFDLQEEIDVGTYNMLMSTSVLYDAANTSFQDSHTLFKTAFPRGFAWEVLEVLAGRKVGGKKLE